MRSVRSVAESSVALRDRRHSAVAYGSLVGGGPASFAGFARRYGGVGSVGSERQIK
jgi:hypothetical protein